MILCERVPWKLSVRGLLAIGVLALVALPGWSIGQDAPTPKNEEPPAKYAPKVPLVVTVEEPVAPPQAAFPPVPEPVGVPTLALEAVGPADPNTAQASGDDARMDALEKKLEALIAEVKAMRSTRNVTGQYGAARQATIAVPAQPQLPSAANAFIATAPQAGAAATTRSVIAKRAAAAAGDVQMLSRGTYAMPKAKADALAGFLREHMKSVEAGVKDDDDKTSLVVTASPEAQAIIGQFIALSEGKQPSPGGVMQLLQPSPNINYYRAVPAQQAVPTKKSAPAKPAVPSEPSAPGPIPPAKK